MGNKLKCSACGFDNNSYERICSSCKSYLRGRVVNIDLWSILGFLIENPFKAFQTIIYAEHKNFVFFLILIVSLKYLIVARLLAVFTVGEFISTTNIFISFLIIFSALTLVILVYSYMVKIIWKKFGFSTRYKDNMSLITYSQIPIMFALIILFPLEIIIFGDYLFSSNPSPFQIKSIIAYIFFSIEILLFLWSFFLSFAAFYVSSRNLTLSTTTSLAFIIILSIIIIISSKIIFTI